MWVGALVRRVMAEGDFATVIHRGDETAGSVVLIHRERDGTLRALQRVIGPDGRLGWRVGATGDSVDSWVERQRRYDPDLWVVELDTPNLARFIDETTL